MDNSFTCNCADGFEGDLCDVDVDDGGDGGDGGGGGGGLGKTDNRTECVFTIFFVLVKKKTVFCLSSTQNEPFFVSFNQKPSGSS